MALEINLAWAEITLSPHQQVTRDCLGDKAKLRGLDDFAVISSLP